MNSPDFDKIKEKCEELAGVEDPAQFAQDKKAVMRGSDALIDFAREKKKQDEENFMILKKIIGKTSKSSTKSIYSCWDKYLKGR